MSWRFIFVTFLLILVVNKNFSQTPDTLQSERFIKEPNLPRESVATSDDITALYFNPAGLGFHPLQVGYFYGHNGKDKIFDHTLFLNILGFAFSTQWRTAPMNNYARHYTIGTGILNSRLFSMGTSYSWYQASQPYLNQYAQWDLGLLFRPFRYISLGAVSRAINEPIFIDKRANAYLDLGLAIRPLPKDTEKFTLAVDVSWSYGMSWRALFPRYQLEVLPFSGITLYGGFDPALNIFFGSKFALEVSQLAFQANVPRDNSNFYSGGILLGRERFKTTIAPLQRWLKIPLDMPFQEYRKEGILFEKDLLSFYDILHGLEKAVEDPHIRGVILTGRNFSGGWAQAEELRQSLYKFNEKKPAYAFLEYASNKEYYIATACEKIVMPPSGSLEINGLKLESYYLKDFLNKIGIQADFITVGKYKSAPESFTHKEPSLFDAEQKQALLQDFWQNLKKAILQSRNQLTEESLDNLVHTGFFSSQKAKEVHLIDEVAYLDEFEEFLATQTALGSKWQVELSSYIASRIYDDSWGPKPELAVIVIDGEIVAGEGKKEGLLREKTVGHEDIRKVVQKILDNDRVKAVVVRINSPGGSALASDLIWREIRKLVSEKKTVVISVGDIAASGGYYIAVAADRIFADSLSITGSIGVFAGKFSLKRLYDWLGVNKYTWKTHKNTAIFTEVDTFSPEERVLLEEQLLDFYRLFLKRVEDSRKLGMSKTEENAQGRIYSGLRAKEKQLIDEQGGLLLAMELALQQAKISAEYVEISLYPEEKEKIFGLGNSRDHWLPFLVRQAIRLTRKAEKLEDERVLFIMPYDFTIK